MGNYPEGIRELVAEEQGVELGADYGDCDFCIHGYLGGKHGYAICCCRKDAGLECEFKPDAYLDAFLTE